MRLIKILTTGEIISVTNNDAHALIEAGKASLVRAGRVETAQANEPRTAKLGQSSHKNTIRQRGKYLIK